mmetsp:Transcript_3608/g.7505  ORF Transcript_3608/g.7505 Transcript_3608/m.7505 type:complete len:255 (+) Transcript_3608:86-850(+)
MVFQRMGSIGDRARQRVGPIFGVYATQKRSNQYGRNQVANVVNLLRLGRDFLSKGNTRDLSLGIEYWPPAVSWIDGAVHLNGNNAVVEVNSRDDSLRDTNGPSSSGEPYHVYRLLEGRKFRRKFQALGSLSTLRFLVGFCFGAAFGTPKELFAIGLSQYLEECEIDVGCVTDDLCRESPGRSMRSYTNINGGLDHVGIGEQSFLVNHKSRPGAFGLSRPLPGLESVPLHLCHLHATDAVALNAHKVVKAVAVNA